MRRKSVWGIGGICAAAGLTALVPAFSNALTRPADGALAGSRVTWTDGIGAYVSEPPLAGYLVPPTYKSYDVPPERLMAVARRLSTNELLAYFRGGKIPPTTDFPLLVYKNRGMNVLLWKGRHDGQQQILPAVWDINQWQSKSYGEFRADAVEYPFYVPTKHEKVHILLRHRNGQEGRNALRTEQVYFSPRQPPLELFNRAMKSGKTVVYLPRWLRAPRVRALDLLSGNITTEEMEAAGVSLEKSSGVFYCFGGEGNKRRVLWSYSDDSGFKGDYGELSTPFYLRNGTIEEMVAENPMLKPYVDLGSFRWRIAKEAAGPKRQGSPCRLRYVERTADGWSIVELTVGKDSPGDLFQRPYDRAGKGGGRALFAFLINLGGENTHLAPDGRFGEVSLGTAEPQRRKELGLEYRFIYCGEGVMKLALRPINPPWNGEITAEFHEAQRLGLDPPSFHQSGPPLPLRL